MNYGLTKTRARLAGGAAILALSAGTAMAQEGVEQVVVSSTRLQAAGFDAPTPTTVVSAADLQASAKPSVFDSITQLPQLQGSTGVGYNTGSTTTGLIGLSALGLRGLSPLRTLVLMDSERVVGGNFNSVVDISQMPQMLIQRVDVVTGGASASWGSDAVTGVINFVTDKKFEGFKLNVNGGISNYADDPEAQVQFAAGTAFMGGRAHFEISGDFTSEAGINSLQGARKWWQYPQQLQMFSTAQCQPNGCPGGSPQWVNVNNGVNVLWAYGGMVTRGPLQ